KVFPEGPPEPSEQPGTSIAVTPRPSLSATAEEFAVAKSIAMGGPFLPPFLRGNPGYVYTLIQKCKQWVKYDTATNSWLGFNVTTVAECCYLVESKSGQTVGYTSMFIGALIDMFVPFASRMRYRYEGEGQERVCTATARLRGDPEPFEYSTPPLGKITPK